MSFRHVLGATLVFATLSISGLPAHAGPQFAVALQGYDAVSFFERGTPAKGEFDYSVFWNGATWLFASEANAQRFKENPTKYAPQFDGYCALAASLGYKAPGDALTGRIVDGKLYLNYNAEAAKLWAEAIPANIRKGEENWPRLNPL
jgi:YHS domain-containing protein